MALHQRRRVLLHLVDDELHALGRVDDQREVEADLAQAADVVAEAAAETADAAAAERRALAALMSTAGPRAELRADARRASARAAPRRCARPGPAGRWRLRGRRLRHLEQAGVVLQSTARPRSPRARPARRRSSRGSSRRLAMTVKESVAKRSRSPTWTTVEAAKKRAPPKWLPDHGSNRAGSCAIGVGGCSSVMRAGSVRRLAALRRDRDLRRAGLLRDRQDLHRLAEQHLAIAFQHHRHVGLAR